LTRNLITKEVDVLPLQDETPLRWRFVLLVCAEGALAIEIQVQSVRVELQTVKQERETNASF